MDSQTTDFDLYTILGVTHGFPIEGAEYQRILEFLTGKPVPGPIFAVVTAVTEQCRQWLFELHPRLQEVPARPLYSTDDFAAVDAWAARQAELIDARVLPIRSIPPERR